MKCVEFSYIRKSEITFLFGIITNFVIFVMFEEKIVCFIRGKVTFDDSLTLTLVIEITDSPSKAFFSSS